MWKIHSIYWYQLSFRSIDYFLIFQCSIKCSSGWVGSKVFEIVLFFFAFRSYDRGYWTAMFLQTSGLKSEGFVTPIYGKRWSLFVTAFFTLFGILFVSLFSVPKFLPGAERSTHSTIDLAVLSTCMMSPVYFRFTFWSNKNTKFNALYPSIPRWSPVFRKEGCCFVWFVRRTTSPQIINWSLTFVGLVSVCTLNVVIKWFIQVEDVTVTLVGLQFCCLKSYAGSNFS